MSILTTNPGVKPEVVPPVVIPLFVDFDAVRPVQRSPKEGGYWDAHLKLDGVMKAGASASQVVPVIKEQMNAMLGNFPNYVPDSFTILAAKGVGANWQLAISLALTDRSTPTQCILSTSLSNPGEGIQPAFRFVASEPNTPAQGVSNAGEKSFSYDTSHGIASKYDIGCMWELAGLMTGNFGEKYREVYVATISDGEHHRTWAHLVSSYPVPK